MLVGLITGRERLDLIDVPEPTPSPTGVVVDISYCGICGTDVHAYRSGDPYSPAICGHEWSGTVSAVGGEVRHLTEGDRVVVAVGAACGRCSACRAGHAAHCSHVFLSSIGQDPSAPAHGGFAARLAVGADRVVKTHPMIDDSAAAQVEPATVALHAVRHSGMRIGDTAVVQGAGPIGLATLQWVRLAGASSVLVVEPDPHRRRLAVELGAHVAVSPDEADESCVRDLTGGLGADIVFECVGHPAAIQDAVNRCRRGGSVCLIGLAESSATIQPATWLVKEISLTAALAYLHEEFDMTMSMIADGRFVTAPLHTSTVSLQALGDTFAALARGGSGDIKVLVDPRE
jgi:(R,R)-butanediol dehydrogenase/meso-butanediol dehydrogenase/diacetyl reductase